MTAGARRGQGPSPLETGIKGPMRHLMTGLGNQTRFLYSTMRCYPLAIYPAPFFPHCSSWGLNPDPIGEEAAYH